MNIQVDESKALREELQKMIHRLSLAESCLVHYANPNSYRVHPVEKRYQNVLSADYSGSDNSAEVFVAGARARAYFKEHEDKKLSDFGF